MKKIALLLLALVCFLSSGCIGTVKAPPVTNMDGPIELYYTFDSGITNEMSRRKVSHYKWNENHVKTNFPLKAKKFNYSDAVLLNSVSEFEPKTKRYLITIKTEKFSIGNVFIGTVVGFGLGSAYMKATYSIYTDPAAPSLKTGTHSNRMLNGMASASINIVLHKILNDTSETIKGQI